jgi:hypothetical protein
VLAHPARGERGHDGARAVEVVRAPAAEPGAVGLLLAEQVLDAAPCGRVVRAPLEGERLEHVRCHVGARRVGHLAEVAEGEPRR